jgi:hypothetical protein
VRGKGWVAAGDLVIGNKVHTLDGDTGTVTGFKLEKLDKLISVYNLEVEDFQTYFVEDLLVHNYSWLHWLKQNGHIQPAGMLYPHGHHILPQVGNGSIQKVLVKIGQMILREVGIDPINGPENLVIAPNIKGQHTKESVFSLVLDLLEARGDYNKVVTVLYEYGQIAVAK